MEIKTPSVNTWLNINDWPLFTVIDKEYRWAEYVPKFDAAVNSNKFIVGAWFYDQNGVPTHHEWYPACTGYYLEGEPILMFDDGGDTSLRDYAAWDDKDITHWMIIEDMPTVTNIDVDNN
jgi:hypothetical protein